MVETIEKIKKLKLIAFDVDGILTDSNVFMIQPGQWRRHFSVRDGYGIQMLLEKGYQVAFITGSNSDDVRERAKVLKINYFYEGTLDKEPAFEDLQKKTGFTPEEIMYMGDDFFDIPLIKKSGFGVTVPDASDKVKNAADFITQKNGGHGAVREICELILENGKI